MKISCLKTLLKFVASHASYKQMQLQANASYKQMQLKSNWIQLIEAFSSANRPRESIGKPSWVVAITMQAMAQTEMCPTLWIKLDLRLHNLISIMLV